ncbi:hypothetical protein [Flavimarina sp. Hel_I_48]|uniref:hypothetical protein n=1 Tax=Flavimarina sp. Hel_I_48 TaxID=1392488 RepID=UPI0004DF8FEC|nr:hypothetical protein [Flavimarina sp. Hel_I_48]
MKQFFIVSSFLLVLFSCTDKRENVITGDFIYIADSAVIKGEDFIYGVEIDSMTMQLAKEAAAFKNGDFDMVPIIIEGSLHEKEKNTEGWDTIVKVDKIIAVGSLKVRQEKVSNTK